jgi:hypothetical protein
MHAGGLMTIGIAVKVHDGIVFASDSASSLFATTTDGKSVPLKVYNNANKIFNLRKGLPIGAMTAGAGSIGAASISTLSKDLRHELTFGATAIDTKAYTVEHVAQVAKTFLYDERYAKQYAGKAGPKLTYLVSGYSSGQGLPELFEIVIGGKEGCVGPRAIYAKDVSGVAWCGEVESIQRLLVGHGTRLAEVVAPFMADKANLPDLIAKLRAELAANLIAEAMPIQDAIDLAEFLVHTAINFSRFLLTAGAPMQTVGGPIEIAAITKHEGFRWVKRKHYFDEEFNRPAP